MTESEILKRARIYAEARWPGVPVTVRLDGDTVVFEYAVSTIVGTVSVGDLEVEL